MPIRKELLKSPFTYIHPESMNAEEANSFFVDYFDYYNYISDRMNTFIHGPRGSGKSMLFRMLRPDCQKLKNNKTFTELAYLGIHIPIKHSDPQIADIDTVNFKSQQGVFYVNEHILVIHILFHVFKTLSDENIENSKTYLTEANIFFKDYFIERLKSVGWKTERKFGEYEDVNKLFKDIKDDILLSLKDEIQNHFLVKSALLGGEPVPYEGTICLYTNFLNPIIKKLKSLSFIPDVPFYFLVDDADWLNDVQKQILNTWISYRDSENICFKVSTQFRYNTYYTTTGNRIDYPHDFTNIDLTEIYTSDTKHRYYSNLKNIVEKRLFLFHNKSLSAIEYFPDDVQQEIKIKELFDSFEKENNYDYAYRYSRLEFMHRLEIELFNSYKETTETKEDLLDWQTSEARKEYMKTMNNKYSYNYAGFKQLVNISSGIIRNFLDPAHHMWEKTQKKNQGEYFEQIPTDIQNSEIRKYSTLFFLDEFESEKSDVKVSSERLNQLICLENLIKGIGGVFRYILLSNLTERRVFAFFFEKEPFNKDGTKNVAGAKKLNDVLKLAIHKGVFLKATKGSKSGIGDVRMYVLNRILAPSFDLDPNSFSGYKYISANWLLEAMDNPEAFIRKYKTGAYTKEEVPNLFSNADES